MKLKNHCKDTSTTTVTMQEAYNAFDDTMTVIKIEITYSLVSSSIKKIIL